MSQPEEGTLGEYIANKIGCPKVSQQQSYVIEGVIPRPGLMKTAWQAISTYYRNNGFIEETIPEDESTRMFSLRGDSIFVTASLIKETSELRVAAVQTRIPHR